MPLSLRDLEFLCTDPARLALAKPFPENTLLAIQQWRKAFSPEQAAALATIAEVRRRALEGGKFPSQWARQLLADDKALQQASSMRLAMYVAGRLVELAKLSPVDSQKPARPFVYDLCCGLGADAIALTLCGAEVKAYDANPAATFCGAHNAALADVAEHARFITTDVTELALPASAIVHIDPDRRATSRRAISMSDYSPGEAFIRRLTQKTRAGALKLSPALHWQVLSDWPGTSVEYLSEEGVCKQLLLWWGLPPGTPKRLATVVGGELLSPRPTSLECGIATPAPAAAPEGFIVEPDPAVIAAGGVDDLARQFDLRRINADLAWLVSPRYIDTPLASCLRLLAEVPGREADVAAAVRKLGGGVVEVKPRGLRLDTDRLQRVLRGTGEKTLAVLWCKLGHKQRAFICERMG